ATIKKVVSQTIGCVKVLSCAKIRVMGYLSPCVDSMPFGGISGEETSPCRIACCGRYFQPTIGCSAGLSHFISLLAADLLCCSAPGWHSDDLSTCKFRCSNPIHGADIGLGFVHNINLMA